MATARQLCDVMKAHPDAQEWSVREISECFPSTSAIAVMCKTVHGHRLGMTIEAQMFGPYRVEAFAEEFNRGMAVSRAHHESGECGC